MRFSFVVFAFLAVVLPAHAEVDETRQSSRFTCQCMNYYPAARNTRAVKGYQAVQYVDSQGTVRFKLVPIYEAPKK